MWGCVEVVPMVPHRCLTLVGGRGGGLVGRAMWPCGGRCSMVAVSVIRVSWKGAGSWPVVGQGIGEVKASGLPRCLTRAVRRAAKISLTRAVCAARASSSVWMADDTCSSANARIWLIAKTGHKLSLAGCPAVRLWGGMISACCRPSRWNCHVTDHFLVCRYLRWAHRHRQ